MNWKVRTGVGLVALAAAYLGGVSTERWRLTAKYQTAEVRREQDIRDALAAAAAHVDAMNRQTEEREQSLLSSIAKGNQTAQELRDELEHRPVIRQVVTKTVTTPAGVVECPAVATVDWGVFQQLYNSAATGEASAPGSSATGLSEGLTNTIRRPR